MESNNELPSVHWYKYVCCVTDTARSSFLFCVKYGCTKSCLVHTEQREGISVPRIDLRIPSHSATLFPLLFVCCPQSRLSVGACWGYGLLYWRKQFASTSIEIESCPDK